MVWVEWFVEVDLGDGDGEAVLVERPFDDDAGREGDSVEGLVVGVEGAGGDLALVVVDVLLVGQEIAAADVDDAEGAGKGAMGLGEELDVVVWLFDEVVLLAGVLVDADVLGKRDDVVGGDALDEHGVQDGAGAEVLEAVFGRGCDGVGAGDGTVLDGDEQLEGFAVGDHVEDSSTDDGGLEENANLFGLADDDVAADAEVVGDLAFETAAGAGDDVNGGGHGLDGGVLVVDALQELVEAGPEDDVGGPGLGNDVRVREASGEDRECRENGGRKGLSYLHSHELQV